MASQDPICYPDGRGGCVNYNLGDIVLASDDATLRLNKNATNDGGHIVALQRFALCYQKLEKTNETPFPFCCLLSLQAAERLRAKRDVQQWWNSFLDNASASKGEGTGVDDSSPLTLLPQQLWWIVGLPRTGSTFFHTLLSQDTESSIFPTAYELRNPLPLEESEFCMPWQKRRLDEARKQISSLTTTVNDTEAKPKEGRRKAIDALARLLETKGTFDTLYSIAPVLGSIHRVTAEEPDECVNGFVDCAFPEWYLWGAYDTPSLRDWYYSAQKFALQQYANYAKVLACIVHFQSENIRKTHSNTILSPTPLKSKEIKQATRFLLKSPHHTVKLDAIENVFGRERRNIYIWLHRDPCAQVLSCCRMNLAVADFFDGLRIEHLHEMGRRTLACLVRAMDEGLQQRDKLLSDKKISSSFVFIDIHHRDLVKDPIGTVRRLYDTVDPGNPLSSKMAERMESFIKRQAQQRKERKKKAVNDKTLLYSLKDFGLTKEIVETSFQSYLDRFFRDD
eukprot:g3873.t1